MNYLLKTQKYTKDIDKKVLSFIESTLLPLKDKISILALGSYARGDMNLYSDIDIGILHTCKLSSEEKKLIEKFYYKLLELKKEIGFFIRKPNEFINLIKEDISVLTSCLKTRFLFGNKEIYEEFNKDFKKYIRRNRKNIFYEILKNRKARLKKFGSTIYYQEPNVKESKGGLRDFHEAFWCSIITFEVENYEDIFLKKILYTKSFADMLNAYNFFLEIRDILHQIYNRKMDILTFENQILVAEKLGYSKEKKGVETFMKSYFQHAFENTIAAQTIFKKCEKELKNIFFCPLKKTLDEYYFVSDNQIFVKEDKVRDLFKNPIKVLESFIYVIEKGYEFSGDITELFITISKTVGHKFLQEPVLNLFKKILLNPTRISYVLELMHDCQILDLLIPDMGRLRGHVQYDTYHKFTTDMHLIYTVREIEKIQSEYIQDIPKNHLEILTSIFNSLEKNYILFIAALLHDIGKGLEGRHEIIGEKIAQDLLKTYDFPEEDIKEICFLIRHHLDMSKFAFRRDIEDPNTIKEFANIVQNPTRLKRLLILTYADLRATNPEAWDPWKSTLILKLFLKTLEYFGESIDTSLTFENLFKKVIQKLSVPKSDILSYFFEDYPELGVTFCGIIIKDEFENFYKSLFGAASALSLDIKYVSSKSYKDNYKIITMYISTDYGSYLEDNLKEKFINLFINALKGKESLDKKLSNIKLLKTFRKNIPLPETKFKYEIKKDNIIFEISTYDRLRLLYDISNTIEQFGFKILKTKIITEDIRAIDTFYIKPKENFNNLKNQLEKLGNAIKNLQEQIIQKIH